MPSRRIHAFISPSFALGPSPTSSSSSRPAALSAAASSLFLAISAIAASSTARAWLRDHPSAHPSPPTEARPLGNRSLETTFSCVPWEDDPPPGASVSRRTRAMIAPASTEPIHPLSLSTHPRTAVSAPPSAPWTRVSSVHLATLRPFVLSVETNVRLSSRMIGDLSLEPPPSKDHPCPAPHSAAPTNVSGLLASISTASKSPPTESSSADEAVAKNAHCERGAAGGCGADTCSNTATTSNSPPATTPSALVPSAAASVNRRGVGDGASRALARAGR
mmetsp:Transcript_1729/g.7703  ORF Transcript_1729/g.7703 Transcript_1729/m.7703 type:complete len:277 (-) Transcript_1729:1381-2211(-)